MSSLATRRLVSAAKGREEATAALAAQHGGPGERPALRGDLVVRRVIQMGEAKWVVKCPDPLEYYSFEEANWELVQLFDGTRSRSEIAATYNARHTGADIELQLILEYEEELRKMHLLERSAAEKSLALLATTREARQRAAAEKAEGFNPFFILFHVFDPNRFLDRTVRYVRWLWTPPVVVAFLFVFAWTIGVFIHNWSPIWHGTIELYAFLRKPLLDAIQFFLILCCIGCIHEFAHAYTTKIYGGEVHDIGIALLYFTPAFYCNTTDSLLFENKWHGLWVTTAGIYIEAILCSGATFLWVASYPDTLLHELAYKTMLFTGVSTVFFNINPLIKIDGYYALTSLLEMSELREESFRYLGAFLQKRVLRLNVELPVASRRKRHIYWIYGMLALAYTGVIMSFIGGLFFNFYSKYFPNVALILLLLTLSWIFKKRVRLVTRTGRLFYLDKKELLMSRKTRSPILFAAAILLLVLFVPWTRQTVRAEAVLRPEELVRISAPEEGVIVAVLAREGSRVSRGDAIFRLASPGSAADSSRAAEERQRFLEAASSAREAGSPAEVYGAQRRERGAEAAVARETARAARLEVRAPIEGRVLTPRLEDLDQRFVKAGELLAEVGAERRMVAELPVSERLLGDIAVGAPVRALLTDHPLRPIRGRIVRISPATLDQPLTATATHEPQLPGETPDRFVALASFDNPRGELRSGAVVRAKIAGRRVSYAARAGRVLWRWLRRTAW